MSQSLSRRSFLGTCAAASLACLPRSLFAAYEAEADAASNDVVLRFSALSDVHFKKSPEAREVDRFRRSMKFMYEYSSQQKYKNFDAMLVAGDFSDHGYEEELTLFKKTMDEGIKEGTTTILCMGNHEFIAGSKERWERIFERPSNKVYEVNGFKFVALSPERGTCRDGDFLYARDWFDKEIAAACSDNSGKPVFTFQHYHVSPTVYGSRGDDNWGTKDLFEVLQKYPRVIDFSGHSHYPINDPRSAWQGRFTAFGTGTLSYFEMGGEGGRYDKFPTNYGNAAQMYVVEVRRDNTVVLKPYDLITETFFDVVYVVYPGQIDKYAYTDKRYETSAKPTWASDAQAVCSSVVYDGANVSFPQATCPDVVHSYRVDLKKADGESWKDCGSRYFWSEYYFKNPPKEMRVELQGLEEQSEYQAEIVALNPFFKESDKRLSVAFKTPKDEENIVDKNAPTPDANMLDVKFVDSKPVNGAVNGLKEQKEIQKVGAPQIFADAALGGALAAKFDGVDDHYKIKFSRRDYGKMSRVTIAAKFKFDEYPQNYSDVFANTEGRGVALELNGKTKELEFWASVDGKYQIVSAPVKPGEYVDAFGTFDGQTVTLYINGKKVASKKAVGMATYPQDVSAQAFCVGSDIARGDVGSSFFKGSVARARVFSWALTAEQVANLSK